MGGHGNDQIDTSIGRDTNFVGTDNDVVYGEDGDDTIVLGVALQSQSDKDLAFGGAGNDRIRGGADDDFLVGGSGDDDISGGAGSDVLWGGTEVISFSALIAWP